jgi:D-glycero-D-manno-heptose 1,7-bisphosphate phosphatase
MTCNPKPKTLFNERAVFLDRDGVINKVILCDGKPYSPRKYDEFVLNDGIREAVCKMKELGYKILVVSNQPDVARGEITQGILDLMTQKMRWELSVDEIYICPHDDPHGCSCRKPKPGMLIQAAEKWKIDLASSFLIGDTWKDIEAGKAAGCRTILLDAPYNQDVQCDFRVNSLSEAVSVILNLTS